MAAGRAVNTEDIGLKEAGVQLDRPRLRQGGPRDARDHGAGRLLHRRRGRPADAGAQGQPRGRRTWRSSSPGSTRTRSTTTTSRASPTAIPRSRSIGLTEEQCKEKKLDYQVGRFPFSANGRARASDETEGFVKIIRDKKYGEILGAHIVGEPCVGDDPRAGRGAGERVHGRRGRSRDPCPSRRCPRRSPRRRSTRWGGCCTSEHGVSRGSTIWSGWPSGAGRAHRHRRGARGTRAVRALAAAAGRGAGTRPAASSVRTRSPPAPGRHLGRAPAAPAEWPGVGSRRSTSDLSPRRPRDGRRLRHVPHVPLPAPPAHDQFGRVRARRGCSRSLRRSRQWAARAVRSRA